MAIRLVDLYKLEFVGGRVLHPNKMPAKTEWRFGPESQSAWEAGPGIADLAVANGRLTGRTTDAIPILHLERTTGLDNRDLLHQVEVRLRVSSGSNLAVAFRESERLDLNNAAEKACEIPWRTSASLLPGNEMRTYILQSPFSVFSSDIRHILIRPTDAVGASFEIESIRLVFRKEYLAAIPSGTGRQGLNGIYRESLILRSPETLQVPMILPARPWLDLAIGTLDDEPITFHVGIRENGFSKMTLLERTIRKSHRWEAAPIDLSDFAGRHVTLSFSLTAHKNGVIGLWGSPVVRNNTQIPQSVILIWVDTLRRDHLSIYGYERDTTPNLSRMASEGILFNNCFVQAGWTKVSTPTLLTSLYPESHGVREFTDRLPSSATTIAEVFRNAGYATLSMSSILFTGQFTNLHQGFEEVQEDSSLPDRRSSKTAREYIDRLLPWLEAHRDVPFFVFLHLSDPHDPYKPYPPYDTFWADPAHAKEQERQTRKIRKFIGDPLLKIFAMPTEEELLEAGFDPNAFVSYERDWYDGAIRGMDAEIGRMLEELRDLDLAGKTLVLFTGDHGEEFLEHGRMFHGQSVYGELINTALVFWGRGVLPRGKVIDQTVEVIDLMPTILEMCGLQVPGGIQGQSLIPLLNATRVPSAAFKTAEAGAPWIEHPAFAEKAATYEAFGAPPPHDTESFTVIYNGWKLIHNTKPGSGQPEYELYNHNQDPLNKVNLAVQHPEIVKRLSKELEAWRKKTSDERLKHDTDSPNGMAEEELERLRSLGYLGLRTEA